MQADDAILDMMSGGLGILCNFEVRRWQINILIVARHQSARVIRSLCDRW